jgi:hypothetical protein
MIEPSPLGWDLFLTEGVYTIQKDDKVNIFKDDKDAGKAAHKALREFIEQLKIKTLTENN